MAKKDKLELDNFDFDSGLDFDFDDDVSSELSEESKASKKRSPVGNVSRGAIKGAAETLASPKFLKETLEKSLPKTYGEVTSGVGEAATGLYELYDETRKELKPRLARISDKLDRLLPENMRMLRSLNDKFGKMMGTDRKSYQNTVESQEDQAVNTMLGAIFQQSAAQEKTAQTRELVKEHVEKKRFDASSQLLNAIATNTATQAQYTTNVTQGYQKKMLELTLRSHLAQREHFSSMSRYLEIFKAQNEAIIKNTSLPEYAKITESERFMQISKNKLIESLYGEGSALKQGLNRLKETGRQFVSGISMSLDSIDMGLDGAASGKEMVEEMNKMMVEMGEEPLTKAEMAGAALSSNAIAYFRDIITKRIKEKTQNNKDITEGLSKAARVLANPSGAISSLRKSDSWETKTGDHQTLKGKGWRALDFILEHFTDENPNRRFEHGGKLDGLSEPTMGFDHRAHVSLVDVIPGHLAAIHREIFMFRTGASVAPLRTYDYQRREFVTQKEMGKRITEQLGREVQESSNSYFLDRAAEDFAGEGLEEGQKRELKRFLGRLGRTGNIEFTPESIRSTRAYESLDPATLELVERRLTALESSEKPEEDLYALTKSMRRVRETTPSLSKSIDRYIKAGYGDLLEDAGVVKKNRDGNFDVDEDAFERFIEENSLVRSDINVKEAIGRLKPEELLQSVRQKFGATQPLGLDWSSPKGAISGLKKPRSNWNPRSAYEGFKKTKLYNWFYQAGVGDDQEHFGPMAQDVQKNLGDEAAPGGKSLDLQSLNGATMAAVQHLGGEVETMKKTGPGGQVLSLIQRDTSKIVSLLQKGKRSGGVSTGGFVMPGEGASYGELIGAASKNLIDLATSVGSDAMSAAGRLFKTGKDKVAKPVLDFLTKGYENNKEPVRKALGTFYDRAMEMAGSVMDFGRKTINETLPAGIKQIKTFAVDVWKKVKAEFTEIKDLYLPGGVKPIIRAAKLKAGFYRDSETGAVITSMDELLAAKSDIVDSAGNVILSLEEKAEGLYDRYGEQIKSTAISLAAGVAGAAAWVGKKLVGGAKTLFEKAKGGFGELTKWLSGKKAEIDWSKFGVSVFSKESHDVLVDIRSILLGETQTVRDRLKLKGKGKSALSPTIVMEDGSPARSESGTSTTLQGTYNNAKNRVMDAGEKLKEKLFADRQEDESVFDFAKRKGRGALDRFKQTKVGEGASRRLGKARGLLSKIPGAGRVGATLSSGASFLGNAASGLFGAFKSFGASSGDAQATTPEEQAALAQGQEGDTRKKSTRKIKDDERTGSVNERHKEIEELKEARKKKAAEADLSLRYKSGENIIDTMMNKLGGLLSMATSGISNLFGFGKSILSKIPGIGKIGGMVKGAMTGLGKGVGAVANGARGLSFGKAALAVGKTAVSTAARVALFAATKTLGVVAAGALSVGGAILGPIAAAVSSPVVLAGAAIAAAGYGIWKLYKYSNRNNTNAFEHLRLRQYGFAYNEAVKRFNHFAYGLEAYLQDERITYTQGQASLNDRKIKTEELLELFNIDKEDHETIENFSIWFKERFKPVFLTHLTALYKVDPNIKLDDVTKLTPTQKLEYLELVTFESGPYRIDNSPVKGMDSLSVESEDIREGYKALIQTTREESEKGGRSGFFIRKPAALKAKPTEKEGIDKAGEEQKEKQRKMRQKLDAEERARFDKSSKVKDGSNTTYGAAPEAFAPAGEDGPAKAAAAPASDIATPSIPSGVPMAAGALGDGAGGHQYLRYAKSVSLEGLRPAVLQRFLGMAEEYGKLTGKTIQVNDAYRSYEQQAALHRSNPQKAAKPGRSLHEFGLAIDINSAEANELDKLGLMKKYGFTRPVGGEPWHLEPAGIQTNIALAKKGGAQADLMVEAGVGRGGGGYGSMSGSTKYRRNHDLAMKLLNLPGKDAEATQVADASSHIKGPVAVSMPDGKSTSAGVSVATVAANDTKLVSEAQKLPSPETLPATTSANVTAKASDAEAKPTNTTTAEQAEKKAAEENQPKKRGTFFQSSSGGVFIDSAGNSPAARERREAGEALVGPKLSKIESTLEKSHDVHVGISKTLERIYEEVRLDKLAPVLAAAMAAAQSQASNNNSLKEQDKRNMQRTNQVNPPALDTRRKTA